MEMTKEFIREPNILVAKKDTKEKLKEMYIKYLGSTKDEDIIRKLHSLNLDLQHMAGSIALTIFAPELTWLIPVGGKLVKPLRLKAYDGIKGIAGNIAGVEIPEDINDEKLELDEEEKKSFMEGLKNTFESIVKKETDVEIENIETKGRTK